MSRDFLTVGSTMRILLLYRGEYLQWVERFMNYLEEQTDGEAMINSIKNGDQPLPRVTQVSIYGTSSTKKPPLKEKSMSFDQEKRIQKIDRLARSFLIQGLPNDIYSLIDSNKTAKDLWDALARHMLGSEYGDKIEKLQFYMTADRRVSAANVDILMLLADRRVFAANVDILMLPIQIWIKFQLLVLSELQLRLLMLSKKWFQLLVMSDIVQGRSFGY
nr:hypothetical protein [Tanacetum cinerariifolium]